MGRYLQGLLLCAAGGSLTVSNPIAGFAMVAAGLCGTIGAAYGWYQPRTRMTDKGSR